LIGIKLNTLYIDWHKIEYCVIINKEHLSNRQPDIMVNPSMWICIPSFQKYQPLLTVLNLQYAFMGHTHFS